MTAYLKFHSQIYNSLL